MAYLFRRFSLFLLLIVSSVFAQSNLDGTFSNHTSYFFEDGKIRHQRYELLLKQNTKLSDSFSSVAEGRARFDAALIDAQWIPRHDFPQSVRSDEMFEAEGRQLYLDYLGESLRAKVGLQYFEWVETLSPYTTDLLSPYDLRFGADGDSRSIMVPVLAAGVNHKLFGGTLDWIVIPLPKHHRLPAGENAYGYYSYLNQQTAPRSSLVVEDPIKQRAEETEFGARYMLNFGSLDLSLIAFYGHQRSPATVLRPISLGVIEISQSYPRIATFGMFATYSDESWVLRVLAFLQPRHTPRTRMIASSNSTETWTHFGLGFDYSFSKDLKVYTETFAHYISGSQNNSNTSDYVSVIRLSNETFENTAFSMTTTLTAPKFSYAISPEIAIKLKNIFRVVIGGRLIGSNAAESDFEMLKHTSRVYLGLEYHFGIH